MPHIGPEHGLKENKKREKEENTVISAEIEYGLHAHAVEEYYIKSQREDYNRVREVKCRDVDGYLQEDHYAAEDYLESEEKYYQNGDQLHPALVAPESLVREINEENGCYAPDDPVGELHVDIPSVGGHHAPVAERPVRASKPRPDPGHQIAPY